MPSLSRGYTGTNGAVPTPNKPGDIVASRDGSTFEIIHPIISADGWLANEDGELLIEGLE